jgi:hypothetical protein
LRRAVQLPFDTPGCHKGVLKEEPHQPQQLGRLAGRKAVRPSTVLTNLPGIAFEKSLSFMVQS